MTSKLRSDTSRANGAKSQGPKSAETRAISAQNALKHGFTSCHTTVLKCEDLDEFQDAIDRHYVTYHPANTAQENLVDEMVSARWRIRRVRIAETQLLDLEMIRNHAAVEKSYTEPEPGAHLAEAVRTLMNHTFSLISRYESRLLRLHAYAYRTLRELQKSDPEPDAPLVVSESEPDPMSPVEQTNSIPSTEPECMDDQTNPAARASVRRQAPQPPDSKKPSHRRFLSAHRSEWRLIVPRLAPGKLLRRQ
jgi:hypothetical protein